MTALAYYPGCSLTQTASIYNEQVKYVCNSLGIQLQEIQDWNCCGATSAGKIDEYMALLMPARNIKLAESQGNQEIIIPCSACFSRTITTLTSLNRDKTLKDRINSDLNFHIQGDIQISNLLDLIWRHTLSGRLKSRLQASFNGLTAVCYYGCMLTRFPVDINISDDPENPRKMEKILNTLGCHTLDWNSKTYCCGASAAVNDREVANRLMSRIFREANTRGADCIVTTCPMCQMNLDAYQEDIKHTLPVFYLTELLGLALGYPPEELKLDRHFIQGLETVKESLEYAEH